MKFKKLLTRITTLVLAICILIPTNLVVFANDWDGQTGGQGSWGSASNDGTCWNYRYGVRLTFIDATDNGKAVSASVDWNTNSGLYGCWSFAKKCKTVYKGGEALDLLTHYSYNDSPPKVVDSTTGREITLDDITTDWNQNDINDYFKNKDVVSSLVDDLTNCGVDNAPNHDLYKKFADGTYDILVEPVGQYHHTDGCNYMATPTEYALADANLGCWNSYAGPLIRGEFSELLYFGEEHPAVGFPEETIDPSYDYGSGYLPATVVNYALGAGLIWTKDPPTGKPQLITHTCYVNYKWNDDRNIKWSDVLAGIKAGTFKTDDGVTVKSPEQAYEFAIQGVHGFSLANAGGSFSSVNSAGTAATTEQIENNTVVASKEIKDDYVYNKTSLSKTESKPSFGLVSVERTDQDLREQKTYPGSYEERKSRAQIIGGQSLAVKDSSHDIHVFRIAIRQARYINVYIHTIDYTYDTSKKITGHEWYPVVSEEKAATRSVIIRPTLEIEEGISGDLYGYGFENIAQDRTYRKLSGEAADKYPNKFAPRSDDKEYRSGPTLQKLEGVKTKDELDKLRPNYTDNRFINLGLYKDANGKLLKSVHIVYVTGAPEGAQKPDTSLIKTYDLTQYLDSKETGSTAKGHDNPTYFTYTDDSYGAEHKDNGVSQHTGGITAWMTSNKASLADATAQCSNNLSSHSWTSLATSGGTSSTTSTAPACTSCHWTKEHVYAVYGARFSSDPTASHKWDTSDNNKLVTNNTATPSSYYAAFSVPHAYMVNTKVLKGNTNPSFNILSANSTDSLFLPRDKNGLELVPSLEDGVSANSSWEIQAFQSDADKDKSSKTAHFTNFSWDKVKRASYVAHRDILSGNNATSLAVSGYMTKYATNAQTWDYLKLMSNTHYGFSGISAPDFSSDPSSLSFTNAAYNIAHNAGKVHVANANTTGSSNFNSDFGKATVQFRLGSNSVNMYSLMDDDYLKDADIGIGGTARGHGDAVRPIWYRVKLSQSTSTPSSHNQDSAPSYTKTAKYATKSTGIYFKNTIGNGKILGTDTEQGSTVSSLYTYVRNATGHTDIEGTFNGLRDAAGARGMTYDTDKFTVENGYYMHNPNTLDKAYTEQAVNVHQFSLAGVGDKKKTNGKEQVSQEYRFTVPSQTYTFNPSVAMAFDDELKDVNKTAWVLSEQPMKVNFKNTLDIRLTSNTSTDAGTMGSASGYPTQIDSEWSTDKKDVDIQNETGLPTAKASSTYKTTTGVVGGTVTAYVVLQDPEFSGNPTAVEEQNKKTLEEYTKQMEKIREQFANATGDKTTDAANDSTKKNNFGIAMYTNLQNGSTQNSAMSELYLADDQSRLDKEQMKLDTDSLMSAKVTTGTPKAITTGLSTNNSWSFYALGGYEVNNLYRPHKDTGLSDTDDISDTTKDGKRSMFGTTIKSSTSAAGHQQDVMDEMNEHLCELLVEQGTSIKAPQGTKPFKGNKQKFTWYNEDYEGFVVAVCEISFAVGNDKGDASVKADSSHLASTDFYSVFRAQSDWRTKTNQYGAISSLNSEYHKPLEYDFSSIAGKYNLNNITGSYCKCADGKMLLMSNAGKKTITDWSKKYDDYAPGVYGVGLELANLKFEFGTITSKDANGDETGWSFFYQPTYFNVRGSVYDTAR